MLLPFHTKMFSQFMGDHVSNVVYKQNSTHNYSKRSTTETQCLYGHSFGDMKH